jgi:hypothetical protein
MDFFNQLATDKDDPRWESHSSFFMTLNTQMELNFDKTKDTISNPFEGLIDLPDFLTDKLNENLNNANDLSKRFPYIVGKLSEFNP